jgi:hypothetical protein
MRKFKEYINEDLNLAKKEPSGLAAKEAKARGLQYVSFGRYADPKTGQVTYIVKNDRLVPFEKAVKTNDYKENNMDDFKSFHKELEPGTDEVTEKLNSHYDPMKFSTQELDAIKNWTDGGFAEINAKLNSLPPGIPVNQIQPSGPDDNTPEAIAQLDKAMGRFKTPDAMTVYTSVSPNFDNGGLKVGSTLQFPSFRSTSASLEQAMQMGKGSKPEEGDRNVVILQIQVQKESPGIYVDNISVSPGEKEFVLNRGSQIVVKAGPSNLSGAHAGGNHNVTYFECEVA